MNVAFKFAKRFLKSNPGQTFLIILGIAIGVSVQVFIGLLIQGLQTSLIDKTIGNSSQITITGASDEKIIENYDEIIERILEDEPDVKNISAADDNAAFLQYEDNSKSVLVRGFNIEAADKIYNIIDRIEEGTYPQGDDEIIIGTELRDEYNIGLNDKIEITTTEGETSELTVVGFFDLDVSTINQNWAITTMETSNKIFGTEGTVSSIEIQVNDDVVFMADEIADGISADLSDSDLTVDNWKAENEQLLSGLQGQSISSIMIQIFVMISVILGIASVLAITVLQKSRQIGILKAMGLKNKTASGIFIFEGLMLGALGAVLGIGLGILLSFAFTNFALNSDGTPIVEIYYNYKFIIISGCIAVGASILASMIPAIRSSKLDPIEIIRNN